MKVNEYTLYVQGIFNRNRTIKLETFKIARIPIDQQLNEVDLDKLVQEKLNEIKLKKFNKILVKVNELTILNENGFTVTQFMPLSAKLVKDYTSSWF